MQGQAEAQQEPNPSPEGIQAEPQPAQGLSSQGLLASGEQPGSQGPVSEGQQPGSALWGRAQVGRPLLHCCTCCWFAEPCRGLERETSAPCALAQACVRLKLLWSRATAILTLLAVAAWLHLGTSLSTGVATDRGMLHIMCAC